jgi:FixJ family two-component response regulator
LVLPAFNPHDVAVLIVDDNPDDIQVIMRALDRGGLNNAFVCQRGEDAIDWLERDKAQVMVLEYRLPGMNGQQVIERLNEDDRLPPTIVLSREADFRLAVNLMKLGAGDFLVKDNYLSSALVRSIQTLLRQRQQDAEKHQARMLGTGDDKLSVAIAEAQWLLKAYKGPYGSKFPQPGEREDLIGSWAEVVEAFRAFLETSLRFFPEVVRREEDALIRMIMQRGLSPRDTVTLYQLGLLALRRPEGTPNVEVRVAPGVILARVLARLTEDYQRALSDYWLSSAS